MTSSVDIVNHPAEREQHYPSFWPPDEVQSNINDLLAQFLFCTNS